jgi:hypothetical protein
MLVVVSLMVFLAGALAYDCGNPGSPTPVYWLNLNDSTGVAGSTLDDVCGSNDFKRNSTTELITGGLWDGAQNFTRTDPDRGYNFSASAMGITTGNRTARVVLKTPVAGMGTSMTFARIGREDGTAKYPFIYFYIDNLNHFHCWCGTGATYRETSTAVAYSGSTWYDVACIYNGSRIAIWVNATLTSSIAANDCAGQNDTVIIGAADTDGTNAFLGNISEFVYYNTDLNGTQLAALLANNSINAPAAGGGAVGCNITANDFNITSGTLGGTAYTSANGSVGNALMANATVTCYGAGYACDFMFNGSRNGSAALSNESVNLIAVNSTVSDGAYSVGVVCSNGTYSNSSANTTLYIDSTPPTASITAPTNLSNFTLLATEYAGVYCFDSNLVNMSVVFLWPNGTQLANYSYSAGGANNLSKTPAIPLSLASGNSSFYINASCSDYISNVSATRVFYNVLGYQNVSAYDDVDGSIVTSWWGRVGSTLYSGSGFNALVSDEFDDGVLDTSKWLTATYNGTPAYSTITEGSGVMLVNSISTPGVASVTLGSSTVKSNYKTFNFSANVSFSVAVGANSEGWAKLYITDNGANSFDVFNVSRAFIAGTSSVGFSNWTFYANSSNYSIYKDGVFYVSVNVTNFSSVYIAFSSFCHSLAGGSNCDSRASVEWVRAPGSVASTVRLPTAVHGAGNVTLEMLNASQGFYLYMPENFTVALPLYTGNATNITLKRAGVMINAFNESNISENLTFSLEIFNSTSTMSVFNQSGVYLYSFNISGDSFPVGAVTIVVSSSGFVQRKYFATVSYNSQTRLNAYLLGSGYGVYPTFITLRAISMPISGALVTAFRQLGGNWVTVEQKYSDDAGNAMLYLNPYTVYRLTFYHPSYAFKQIDIEPEGKTYYVFMEGGSNLTVLDYNNLFYWNLYPRKMRYEPNETITIKVHDPDGKMVGFGVRVLDVNNNTMYDTNITGSPYGGELVLNLSLVPLGNYSSFYGYELMFYYDRNADPWAFFDLFLNYTVPGSGMSALESAFFFAGLELPEEAKLFLAFVVTAFAAMAVVAGPGIASKAGGGLFGIAILLIFAFFGWVSATIVGLLVLAVMGAGFFSLRGG